MASNIPKPRRYLIEYQKADGQTVTRQISLPIEDFGDRFNAYAFADGETPGGVRTFVKANIKSLRLLGKAVAV